MPARLAITSVDLRSDELCTLLVTSMYANGQSTYLVLNILPDNPGHLDHQVSTNRSPVSFSQLRMMHQGRT